MYTIKNAAVRAGVPVATLRAWERRYGVVQPIRTSSGYRLYDDDAVARLSAMAALTKNGWSARDAAKAVSDQGIAAAAGLDLSGQRFGGGMWSTPAERVADDDSRLTDRFVAAAAALDGTAVDRVLDEMFIRGSFEQVVPAFVFPALHGVGEAWSNGSVSVAGEHAASHAVARRLAAAYDAAARSDSAGPEVVVGLPPHARHELGALAFATASRRRGMAVIYLGADVPIDDWVVAAGDSIPVIGVPMRRDRKAALAVVDGLRRAGRMMPIAVGGPAAAEITKTTSNVVLLPDDLNEAVEVVRALTDNR